MKTAKVVLNPSLAGIGKLAMPLSAAAFIAGPVGLSGAQLCSTMSFQTWQINGPQTRRADTVVADLNGDGEFDLASVHDFGPDLAANIILQPGFGDEPGTSSFIDPFPVIFDTFARAGTRALFSLAAGDVNGDGDADMVIGDFNGTPAADSISVLFGNGDLTYQPEVTFDTGGSLVVDVQLADLDNDGDLDVVAALFESESVAVMLNNGQGVFTLTESLPLDGNRPEELEIADLNCDDEPDLAILTDGGPIVAFLNDGSAGFTAGGEIFPAPPARSLEGLISADLNRDGRLDLVAGNADGDSVIVLVNSGDGTFAASTLAVHADGTNGDVNDVGVGDFDGDYLLDIAAASDERIFIYRGLGDGTFEAPIAPDTIDLNFAFQRFDDAQLIFIEDIDQNGSMDVVVHQRGDVWEWTILYNACEGPPPLDFDASGSSDVFDLVAYLAAVDTDDEAADTNRDGSVEVSDVNAYIVGLAGATQRCEPFTWPIPN